LAHHRRHDDPHVGDRLGMFVVDDHWLTPKLVNHSRA
jgi:hypothetical protein